MPLALQPTQERILLHGIAWTTFACLLADRGDQAGVRFAYDQGTMELTMPSAEHETMKHFFVLIVDAIAFNRDLHLLNAGSTTFTRDDLARGFEPDACFYLQHTEALPHPQHIDLAIDPPPDLVLDIGITSLSLDKLPIYAAIGVPEVWRYTRTGVAMYQYLQGEYRNVEESTVLPGIRRQELDNFLAAAQSMGHRTAWFKTVVATLQGRGDG